MPRRLRFRVSLRVALLLVALAGIGVWWSYTPLARARMYRALGWIDWAWKVSNSSTRNREQLELLASLMQEKVVRYGEEKELWRALPWRQYQSAEWNAVPWWIILGPRALPVALQELRVEEVLAEADSPERDQRLSALFREGLGRKDEIWEDLPFIAGAPYQQQCLWDFLRFMQESRALLPEWVELSPDGLQIEQARQSWTALTNANDPAGAVAMIERLIAEPATATANLWEAFLFQGGLRGSTKSRNWFEEGNSKNVDLLRSAWELALKRDPSPTRDRLLGAIAAAGVDSDWRSKNNSLWLDAWLAGHSDDARTPSWAAYGPNGYSLQLFLDQFESWPLGRCGEQFEDPDAEVWNLACAGILEVRATQSAISPRWSAAIYREILNRYRARRNTTLAWPYLIAAETAEMIRRHDVKPAYGLGVGAPSFRGWFRHAFVMRLGHVPSFDLSAPTECIHCRANRRPAFGIAQHEDGEIEWQESDGTIHRAPPFQWWLEYWVAPRMDLRESGSNSSQVIGLVNPWLSGTAGRERVTRVIEELSDWPWFACLSQKNLLDQVILDEVLAKAPYEDSTINNLWLRGGEGAAAAYIAMAARVHMERNLQRQDLPHELKIAAARMASAIAVAAAGLELLDSTEILANRARTLRFGHYDDDASRSTPCAFCEEGERPASGVEEQPDGSLVWKHPLRGLVTIAPATQLQPVMRPRR